jgi:hypothetical protein
MDTKPIPSGGQVRREINLKSPEDVAFWIAKWKITGEQLQTAVNYVGRKETRVLDYLRHKGHVRF